MNIIEAIQSGKPFRRKDKGWMWINEQAGLDGIIDKDDILADDWEVKVVDRTEWKGDMVYCGYCATSMQSQYPGHYVSCADKGGCGKSFVDQTEHYCRAGGWVVNQKEIEKMTEGSTKMGTKEEIMQKITELQEELKLYDRPTPKLGQVWGPADSDIAYLISDITIASCSYYCLVRIAGKDHGGNVGPLWDTLEEMVSGDEFLAHNITEYFTRGKL